MTVAMLTKEQLRKLMGYPAVVDVENEGMEDDRFLVHLRSGYRWDQDRSLGERTKGFNSYMSAKTWLDKRVIVDAA